MISLVLCGPRASHTGGWPTRKAKLGEIALGHTGMPMWWLVHQVVAVAVVVVAATRPWHGNVVAMLWQWCSHDMAMAWQWRVHAGKKWHGNTMAGAWQAHAHSVLPTRHHHGVDGCLVNMDSWALVLRAHAHLGASRRCTCTLGRRSPEHMHTWAPKCACVPETGAQVCMRVGDRRPRVHVRPARAGSVHLAHVTSKSRRHK